MIKVINNTTLKDINLSLFSIINYVDSTKDTQIKQNGHISIELNIGYETTLPQYESYEKENNKLQFNTTKENTLLAFDDNYLFLALHYNSIDGIHANITEAKYSEILKILNELNYNNLVRVWNYIPNINQNNPNGLENYKDFCAGRSKAFAKHYENSHYKMPSASAVGINGNKNIIYLIAKKSDEKNKIYHIENPRQIPAYNYPKQYGDKSPSFARATLDIDGDKINLFVSGTASIVGHQSLHLGDVEKQTLEAIKNIKTVSSLENINKYANLQLKDSINMKQAKIYVRHKSDIGIVKEIWENEMKFYNNIYCHTDICREELLVEIECIFSND